MACKKAHGAEVMPFVGFVDGKVLPVQWFEGSVDSIAAQRSGLACREGNSHQEILLVSARWCFSPLHKCTREVMAFLASKFGNSVISCNTEHSWPQYLPDLNPLDF